MRLYLLRHAVAASRGTGNDADRPLTSAGSRRMLLAARGIRRLGLKPSRILSSPLVRARQTAGLTVKALGTGMRVELSDFLRPGVPPKRVLVAVRARRLKSVLLVGHEPDLGELAAFLLGSHPGFLHFRKGGLCCIALGPPPRLEWHLTPGQLRKLGRRKG